MCTESKSLGFNFNCTHSNNVLHAGMFHCWSFSPGWSYLRLFFLPPSPRLFPLFLFSFCFSQKFEAETTRPHRQRWQRERERATCGKKDETPHNGQSSLIPRKHSKFLGPIDLFVYFQFQILKQFSFNPIFIVKIRGAKCQKKGSLCKGNPSECTPS